MQRRAWEWWVDEASPFAVKDDTKLVLRSTISMDFNASCELFADRQLLKHKKTAYAYHSISLYATVRVAASRTAHYLSSNLDAKIPSFDPSGILHITSTSETVGRTPASP